VDDVDDGEGEEEEVEVQAENLKRETSKITHSKRMEGLAARSKHSWFIYVLRFELA
jgi:hypothetical protein